VCEELAASLRWASERGPRRSCCSCWVRKRRLTHLGSHGHARLGAGSRVRPRGVSAWRSASAGGPLRGARLPLPPRMPAGGCEASLAARSGLRGGTPGADARFHPMRSISAVRSTEITGSERGVWSTRRTMSAKASSAISSVSSAAVYRVYASPASAPVSLAHERYASFEDPGRFAPLDVGDDHPVHQSLLGSSHWISGRG
jgi:hypothetical protein